jgi:hypothetical protein
VNFSFNSKIFKKKILVVYCLLLIGCLNVLINTEFVAKAALPLPQYSASYPGTTVTLPSGDNDGYWIVNQPDRIYTDRTRMTNTINHGGALLSNATGLDHIVMSVRGSSLDAGLQILSPSVPIVGAMYYGEFVGRTVPNPHLANMISGRGITFWPAGSSNCTDKSRPCAIFENYTIQSTPPTYPHYGDGLMESGNRALSLTSSPFNVTLTADDYDLIVSVTQNGVNKGNFSCRTITGNDPRCGAQANDAGYADAFAAFVNGSAMTGRTIGVTNINVTHSFYGDVIQ